MTVGTTASGGGKSMVAAWSELVTKLERSSLVKIRLRILRFLCQRSLDETLAPLGIANSQSRFAMVSDVTYAETRCKM